MTIKVLYFAGLREAIGSAGEEVPLPAHVKTVGDLRAWLAERHPVLAGMKYLRCAVNQTMATAETAIQARDEVAFFPPVTGG